MDKNTPATALILGVFIFAGLSALGYQLADAAITYKQFERSVTVKGLSEREFPADIVIWPIQFTLAGNELAKLYETIEGSNALIGQFLAERGVIDDEVSFASPSINDKSAQQYGTNAKPEFRYSAVQTVTVYSTNIVLIRKVMGELSQLGKKGIVFSSDNYQAQIEYIFTRLNDVKPQMIEQATRKAREVAEKFAADSQSALGKIKHASQGQFSISARDKNSPHIKKLRVVSTVEYYLSD